MKTYIMLLPVGWQHSPCHWSLCCGDRTCCNVDTSPIWLDDVWKRHIATGLAWLLWRTQWRHNLLCHCRSDNGIVRHVGEWPPTKMYLLSSVLQEQTNVDSIKIVSLPDIADTTLYLHNYLCVCLMFYICLITLQGQMIVSITNIVGNVYD